MSRSRTAEGAGMEDSTRLVPPTLGQPTDMILQLVCETFCERPREKNKK